MVEDIRHRVKPLYESGDLLGFVFMSSDGESFHNESFLCDSAARDSMEPFVTTYRKLARANRYIKQLVTELDDVILVHSRRDDGHVLYSVDIEADIDQIAAMLKEG